MDWWPQCVWKSIHNFAAFLEEGDEDVFRQWFVLTLKLLCCHDCRKNATKELEMFPIDDYIYPKSLPKHILRLKKEKGVPKTKKEFVDLSLAERAFLYTYLIHDSVNQRLGKKSPPYAEVKEIYWQRLGKDKEGEGCGSCNASNVVH